jgi:hypothetical protein
MWFLRIQITGFRARRYGPFPTKRRALLFLDRFAEGAHDAVTEASNFISEYQIPDRSFASRGGHYPIVEDELATASVSIMEPAFNIAQTGQKGR